MKKKPSDLELIRAWIAAGNQGTCEEIGVLFSITREQAYYRLRRLRDDRAATVVSSRPSKPSRFGTYTPPVAIWGQFVEAPVADNTALVKSSIASRPDLMTVCMKPTSHQGAQA